MASGSKRKSKSIMNDPLDDVNVQGGGDMNNSPRTGPTGLLFRIEEVTGVPSPTSGVTADVYWQLDLGSKRATGHAANIVGTAEAAPCSAVFHDDFVVKRVNASEPLLLTLRSSALGNGCFGKVEIDIEKDLADGRIGAAGETLVMKWLSLVPYFKSNKSDVVYDMKARIVVHVVEGPEKPEHTASLSSFHNQSLFIMNDPKGTLPGAPIKSLLFLHRTVGAEKIAKGSLLIDTIGEAKVLVAGKIGKRKSFFSSGEASSLVFPGVSAVLDSETGIMERDAQDLIAKASAGNGSPSSSGSSSPKLGLAELSKSPRASQRASLLFKGGPKITDFDEAAKTYAWALTLPVPNVSDGITLPPSSSYANDGTDIFDELGKTTDVAFGVRHVVNARCGLMVPAQTPFVVHGFGAQNVAPAAIEHSNITINATLHIDYSNAGSSPKGKPEYTLEASLQGKAKGTTKISFSVFGSVGVGSDGALGNEWKAFTYDWMSPSAGSVLKHQVPSTAVFGPPVTTKHFSTGYFVSVEVTTDSGSTSLPKVALPVNQILPEEFSDEGKLEGSTLDTLQMRSTVIETPFIAIPPIFPGGTVSLYSSETGEPLSFDAVFGGSASGGGGRRNKSKKSAVDDTVSNDNTASPATKRKSKKTEPVELDEVDATPAATASSPTAKRKSKKTEPVLDE